MKDKLSQKEKKKCATCKRVLDTIRFNRNKSTIDGLNYSCRECRRKVTFEFYEKNKKRISAKYREKYPAKAEANKRHFKKKYTSCVVEIFNLLGNQCKRCGERDRRVLQIDHKNGGGGKERRMNKSGLYNVLNVLNKLKEGDTSYQLLCANHNLIEAFEKGYKKTIWQK